MNPRILIVEDDQNLGPSIQKYLQGEGMNTTLVQDLDAANKVNRDNFDLVILDWMLPDGQGIDFLRETRKSNTILPFILLTARTELVDKILGLETGANDYMTKPFEPRELAARIRVQLREAQLKHTLSTQEQAPKEQIDLGPVRIDLSTREVFHEDKLVEMTKMEFDLLRLFVDTPNRVFSREEILNKVWGYDNYPTTRTVDTHILQLRQKLPALNFETVRGIGYRLKFD
ncbi:MAG: response regulator transcription factor [Halobacteriovoraceae bacterium]|nr:response regulator transcription factor [Halobacteriovoraceae bacterium]